MPTFNKSEVVYQAIRRAIIEQALVPGTKLPEDPLGQQFQVSRTLVRAALARLASEGLVDVGQKRSAAVAHPSLEEARAIFEVRRCLENEVVRLVIARWRPEMGAQLEGHVRQEEQAAKAGQVMASSRLAGEFHNLLAGMTGNPVLERYLSELVTRCSLILAVYGRPHSSDCAISEHRELIEALRRGDATQAQHLMGHHLEAIETRALLPDVIRSEQDLASILARYAEAVTAPQAARALKPAQRKARRA
ncbi:MAG: GntR family transcriptional regulator [Pseudomonadota bacterium]